MLTFWEIESYGGVGTSGVDREYEESQYCPLCDRRWQPKGFENAKIDIAGKGTKWPDILTCNILLFHERVVEAVTDEGLKGFIAHPTEIVEIAIKKLAEQRVPDYYLIEITGGVEVDPNELDDQGGSICPVCLCRTSDVVGPYRWNPKRVVPMLETWDGSDFVRTRNWRTGMYYCTRAFVDLACEHQWTNFVFGHSMPGVGLWGAKPPKGGLSYYDREWFDKTSERVKTKNPDLFVKAQ